MDFLAQLDQLKALLRDISPVLWGYYFELKKQGFTDEQAFQLTRDFQMVTFNNSKG